MTRQPDPSLSLSRRTAMTGLAAALGTAAIGPGLQRASAQTATPAATPTAVDEISYLFVQSGFTSGSLEPASEADTFLLTLQGAPAQTIWFTDRPNRAAGLVETIDLLDTLGFEDDPPNAALLIQTEDGETDVIILELTGPAYDPAAATLSFTAIVIADEVLETSGLGFVEQPLDSGSVPMSFGRSSLFIDSASGCNWGDTHNC